MRALNPVLRRELTERWRGRRAFWVVTVYVGGLALVMQLMYMLGRYTLTNQGFFGGGGVAAGPALGRFLFDNLFAFILLLVLFIAPGYAAAQISGERERRSLALLQVTLLRPRQIVAGKLGAATAWLVLLVLTALPFGAAAFFLGGVTVADLVRATGYVVAIAIAVAAIGLGVSSLTKRTAAAVVLTYAIVLALVVGTLFAAAVEVAVRAQRDDFTGQPEVFSLYLNPFFGLADAAGASRFAEGSSSTMPTILTPFAYVLPRGPEEFRNEVVMVDQMGVGREVVLGEDVRAEFVAAQPGDQPGFLEPPGDPRPVWLVELGLYACLGALGLVVAHNRVKPRGVRTSARRRSVPAPPAPQAPPAV